MPARARSGPRESALGVVEVLIAVLLLAAVVSGVTLAVTTGLRTQTATSTAKSLHAVAQRSFEHIRSERDWIDSCGIDRPTCALTVPETMLEDKSLGDACSGSGPYRHDAAASATPVDSAVDGRGAGDEDRKLPDHYLVRITVSAAPCAAARLGNPAPAVYVSALDRSGDVSLGTLEVEVCSARNQVDDRMSVGGCAAGAGDGFRMFQCPPPSRLYDGTPAEKCPQAWGAVAGRGPDPSNPSPYTMLERSQATFRLVDAQGNVVARSSGAQQVSTGVYRFTELPSGVYFLSDVVPVGGPVPNMELWDTKVIPGKAGIVVQPEVASRALITLRPPEVGGLDLRFRRVVTRHDAYLVRTGWQRVTTRHPTRRWQGPAGTLRAAYLSTIETADVQNTINSLVQFFTLGLAPDYTYIPVKRQGAGPNCVWLGFTIFEDGAFHSETGRETCTWYDLDAKFDYYTTRRLRDQRRNGAVIGQSLATSPMPTYRYVVPVGTVPRRAGCPLSFGASGLPPYGGRVTYETYGCVPTRDASNYVMRLDKFAPGLNAGLTGRSDVVATRWGTQFIDDGGGEWTVSRNESIRPIPAGLKRAIWVKTNGWIVDAFGNEYAPGQTLDVVGRGECYWYYNGSNETLGSCDPCEPFIQPLNGAFPSCFILVKVTWKKHFYCTGFITCSTRRGPYVTNTLQACDGPPRPGDVDATAPNCSPTMPNPRGGGGGRGQGADINSVTAPVGGGSAESFSTGIGY